MTKYDVFNDEGHYQPDSSSQVLSNHQGISKVHDIHLLELHLLSELYKHVFSHISKDQPLTVEEIKEWHRKWLGNVYSWAGEERSVNLGKGGFQFAVPIFIPRLLDALQHEQLDEYTPCHSMSKEHLIHALAETHVELILIHPFREGNGRISRLVADVMAWQAGFSSMDYSVWDNDKTRYISAIHQGVSCNFAPMETLFAEVLREKPAHH